MESVLQPVESAAKLRVLVVDADPAMRSACCEIASGLGYAVDSTADTGQARNLLRSGTPDILLVNLPWGSNQDLELVSESRLLYPRVSVIAMTPTDQVGAAVEAIRTGASDYLTKPFAIDELSAVLERAGGQGSGTHRDRPRVLQTQGQIIGHSPEIEKISSILSKVAQSSHPVLILGESGTGKELVARTLHACGPNAQRPFLPVGCGSMAPALIESELFGHVKDAFAGASSSKDGLLVSAQDGTVFLDEVGELPLGLQARLLRALEEREVRPIGGTHRVPLRARIVAATNRNLAEMVENGTFRKDLFYRLNVVNLRLPALRDRREDIPLLAAYFLDRISQTHEARFTLNDQAVGAMMRYDWPGNVRELENALESASTLSVSRVLEPGDLPAPIASLGQLQPRTAPSSPLPAAILPAAAMVTPIADLERKAILDAIRVLKGDKLKAARLLGIGKTTLYRKLKEYGMDPMQSA